MPFKDTPDGSTHYVNDGCGEPAHNEEDRHAYRCASIKECYDKGYCEYDFHRPELCDCDGYHTFSELYDHRITLYITLCKFLHEVKQLENPEKYRVWRSRKHSDGKICFETGGQYILGIGTGKGTQITYHIPIERWNETDFAETLEEAPTWDMHTSDDVLKRLKNL